MWLFTRHGFFSVVCGTRTPKAGPIRLPKVSDKKTMMIRARSKIHLQALQVAHESLLGKVAISTTSGTDYKYRMILPRDVWLKLALELAEEVDYGNFKSECGGGPLPTPDRQQYTNKLHDVWDTMAGLQPGGPYGGTTQHPRG